MNKLIIITPSYRVQKLPKILKSINLNYILEWIIVYDGSKIPENFQQFSNYKKIVELVFNSNDNEVQGNAQRNFGLNYIEKKYPNENIFVYFLDDDNIIHPRFYELIKKIRINHTYSFDQQRTRYVLSGENPKVFNIDLAMFLFDFKLIKNTRFELDKYEADGIFVEECCNKDISKHVYLSSVYCYYNYLGRNVLRRTYYRIFWFLRHFLSNNFNFYKIIKQKKP